jgi:hypothetical protein
MVVVENHASDGREALKYNKWFPCKDEDSGVGAQSKCSGRVEEQE